MCTFTVVALSADVAGGAPAAPAASFGGFRIAFNRDESRRRPAGLPPVERVYGPRRALLPIDPVSDGGWIGVNDAGLALALLNVYAPPPASTTRESPPADDPAVRPWTTSSAHGRLSRGGIIPGLLHLTTAAEVAAALRRLALADYPPFRVVATDALGEIRDLYSDARTLRLGTVHVRDGPLLLTSSGLGDGVVDPPRRRLFEETVYGAMDPLAAQATYHRHSWPDARHLSVCMSRADARTVSHTTIDVTRELVAIEYWPEAPDQSPASIRRALPREAVV
ncbi:MAG: hypothetical protein AB7Q17_17670 [Phycisphaerae bacterium]